MNFEPALSKKPLNKKSLNKKPLSRNIGVLFCFFLCGFSPFKKVDLQEASLKNLVKESFILSEKEAQKIQKELKKITNKYSSQAIEWWVLYKRSLIFQKKNPEVYCYNMQFLSQVQKFPLKHYAALNFYSHCHEGVEVDLSYFPEWLHGTVAKEWYNKAKKQKKIPELMHASHYMYTITKDRYLRERYLVTAIKMAKEAKSLNLKKWEKELHILSPRFIKNPSDAQKLEVANDFRRNRQFGQAILYYRELLNKSKPSFRQKNESFKWLRKIYRIQNNNKKYLIATLQWKNWLKVTMKKNQKASGIYHNIFYLLANTQWTLNQTSEALKTLSQMEKELSGKFSLFQVYRIKALIFREKKKWNKSIFLFQKALKESAPSAEIKEKTIWDYAWTLKKTGQLKKSISLLKKLLNISQNDYLSSRVLFWIGRMYEDMNKEKTAKTIYKQLIEKDPLSYYGLLAHYKLKKKIHIDREKDFLSKNLDDSDYIIVQWLLSLDENEPALDLLNYKLKKYQKSQDIKAKTWSTLFYYMAKSGSYFPLFRTVGNLPLKDRTIFFRSYTDLMFPQIFVKEISKASSLFNLEKEIMYALIRQESAWNPRARSSADAFGLTQIRPFVARKQALKQGISYKGARDLYNPEKNILLGTSFFKDQFNKYDSQFIITVAVYNAGRKAVLYWMKNLDSSDPLSFIENIPYQETKTYVRLLIRNFVFYKLLNSPDRKINFPEWLLHMKLKPNTIKKAKTTV